MSPKWAFLAHFGDIFIMFLIGEFLSFSRWKPYTVKQHIFVRVLFSLIHEFWALREN